MNIFTLYIFPPFAQQCNSTLLHPLLNYKQGEGFEVIVTLREKIYMGSNMENGTQDEKKSLERNSHHHHQDLIHRIFFFTLRPSVSLFPAPRPISPLFSSLLSRKIPPNFWKSPPTRKNRLFFDQNCSATLVSTYLFNSYLGGRGGGTFVFQGKILCNRQKFIFSRRNRYSFGPVKYFRRLGNFLSWDKLTVGICGEGTPRSRRCNKPARVFL